MEIEEISKRELEAEWVITQRILNDLVTNDLSKESYESKKDSGLLRGKISWEMWKRYYTENLEKIISQLKTSTEYKDVDGVIYSIKGDELINTDLPNNFSNKEKLELDGNGRSMSNLSEDTANLLKDREILFFRPNSRKIVEIGLIKDREREEKTFTGFIEMRGERFITLIEKYANVGNWKNNRFGETFNIKSLTTGKANIILNSHIIEETLPQIRRIFSAPIPIIYNEKLTFPKDGYDERFSSWKNYNSVTISNPTMNLEDAKKIIEEIYNGFCFGTPQDKTNAIAGLLTPFLRGLFKKFNILTPAFIYTGNRPGVGKDFCAGIPSLVIEGSFQEDTPICDTGRGVDGDELRKKITTAIRNGRKSMHFSNNKGSLHSAILEKLITDSMWTDRILKTNEEIIYPNELELSLSGNIPLRFSEDIKRRSIFIHQTWAEEDMGKRKFPKYDLHEWIINNRELILSALYSLVRNWVDKNKPQGKRFPGFNHWSEICSGIMESAGYDSPCIINTTNEILVGEADDDKWKSLWELCYEKFPNTPINKHEIIFLIKQSDLFPYLDFEKRNSQTKFGIDFNSKRDRIFNNIQMTIFNPHVRSDKFKFIFSKKGDVGDDRDIYPSLLCETKKIHILCENVPKVPNVPKLFKSLKNLTFMVIKDEKEVEFKIEKDQIYQINDLGDNSDDVFKTLLKNNQIIEVLNSENQEEPKSL